MQSFTVYCTCFLLPLTLALILTPTSCIILLAAPAQTPPPPPPPPSSNICSFLHPNSSLLSKTNRLPNISLPIASEYSPCSRNLFLFNQTSFPLQEYAHSFSTSFTFTTTYSEEDYRSWPGPSIALIIITSPLEVDPRLATAPSSLQFKEVSLDGRDVCPEVDNPFHDCRTFVRKDLHVQDFRVQAMASVQDDEALAHQLKDELSLTYVADIVPHELCLQVNAYRYGKMKTFTFNLSTNWDSPNEETTTFFVGYITNGEASLNVTPLVVPYHHHTTTHTTLFVIWVVLGTFLSGALIGLIILLVLFIKKQRKCHAANASRPIGNGGSPPLVARRARPISRHDLESSVTPMMSAPPLPPLHSSAFEISGTASWLKQPPNPR